MAKGAESKNYVANKILECFGEDFAGIDGSKIYVWAYENGQKIQVCLAMTNPKNIFEGGAMPEKLCEEKPAAHDWSSPSKSMPSRSVEITEEEKENIANLLNKFNL